MRHLVQFRSDNLGKLEILFVNIDKFDNTLGFCRKDIFFVYIASHIHILQWKWEKCQKRLERCHQLVGKARRIKVSKTKKRQKKKRKVSANMEWIYTYVRMSIQHLFVCMQCKEDEVWMNARGLEVLSSLDKIYVSQRLMPLQEYSTNYFTYQIKNERGENVYRGLERPSILKYIFENTYPFKMDLVNQSGTTLVHLVHPCSFPLCPCIHACDKKIKVYAPPGHYIGQVLKIVAYKYSEYIVQDANDKEVLYIDGPPFYKNIAKVTMSVCTYANT